MRSGLHTRIPFLLLAVAAVSGCQSVANLKQKAKETTRTWVTSSYDDPKAEQRYQAAEVLMTESKFDEARVVMHELAGNNRNPKELCEKARFQEAECYRFAKKYPDACDTYHKLMMDYPSGVYREQASTEIFRIADYWLDDTRAEIQMMRDKQSTSWMKVKRQFTIDRTKPTSDIEGRALQALDHVSTDGIGGPNVDKALFWAGYVKFIRGNYEEADHYFSMLHSFHPDSPLRPIATEYAIMCKNNATGGSPYDGQKAAEALQLVHHAEASMPEFRTDDKADFLTRQKFAIRTQQADKDYKMAQFYEQTGHPGSAYFYYEIVRRRYPGTKYSDLATARMQELKVLAETGELQPKTGNTFEDLRRTWKRWNRSTTVEVMP